MADEKLRLEGVHKAFGATKVLQGIDLVVRQNEVVCLIGPSGCGKSTILRCVDLLDTIDSGRIWFDGQDISAADVDANAVRRRIGIVFQAFNLFPHLNLLDNVTLGARRAQGVPRAEAEARAMDLLARFSLSDKAASFPNRLSGGQNRARRSRASVDDRPRGVAARRGHLGPRPRTGG